MIFANFQKRLFCSSILCTAVLLVLGQPVPLEQYDIEVYDTRQGLASPYIRDIDLGKDGSVWVIHSAGVGQFDGYRFSNYAVPVDVSEGQVLSDPFGGVWVQSDQALYVLTENQFKPVAFSRFFAIAKIYFDSHQRLWMIGVHGIYVSHPEQYRQSKFTLEMDCQKISDEEFPGALVIEEDREGGIFVNKFNALYHCSADGQMRLLGRVDEKGPSPYIRSLTYLSSGKLLIGAKGGAIFEYPSDLKIPVFQEKDNDDFGETFSPIIEQGHKIWCLYADGIEGVDLENYEQTDSVRLYESLGIKLLRDMVKDEYGNFWIASIEGLIKLSPPKIAPPITPYPELRNNWKDGLYAINQLPEGPLLLGENNQRVLVLDQGQLECYIPRGHKVRGEVRQLMWDHLGFLWVFTSWGGINRWNGQDTEPLPLWTNTNFNFIFEDRDHYIWLGADDSFFKFKNKKDIDSIKVIGLQDQVMGGEQFEAKAITQDDYGVLWMAIENTLWAYFPEEDRFVKRQLPCQPCDIVHLITDEEGALWLSTLGEGIFRIPILQYGILALDQIQNFGKREGLISDYPGQVIFDEQNNAWVGSLNGLSVLRKWEDDFIIASYPLSETWIDSAFVNMQLFYDRQKTMWGATSRGLFSFQPDQFKIDSIPPVVYLTKLELPDTNFLISDYVDHPLILPNGSFAMTFNYAVENIANSQPIRYRYRFTKNGAVEDWSPISSENQVTRTFNSGQYLFEVKAYNASGVPSTQIQQMAFRIKAPPLYSRLWFWAIILSFLISGFGMRLSHAQQKKLEAEKAAAQARQKELEEREYKVEAENELLKERHSVQQLRANPHFVSNAISSILNLIRVQKSEEARTYLLIFHEIQRKTLEISNRRLIRLGEEVKFLTKYLQVENLRFNQSIAYSIAVDDEQDEEVLETMIPYLLVQPFVENAIIHGLFHKRDGVKKLQIKFQTNEEELCCSIEDNGIGREATKKLDNHLVKAHISHGMSIVAKRLEAIQRETGKRAFVKINDLYDAKQCPLGTRVEIVLPSDLS
ncbi:MAG: histidine kinase [Bacteroidota bacterium]